MDSEQIFCPRDGAPTKLRCARCGAAICPACLVRTPVGYKCAGCAGDAPRAARRGPTGTTLLAALAVLALVVGIIVATRSPSGRSPADPVAVQAPAGEAAPTAQAMLGEEARDGQLTFVVDEVSCAANQAAKLCTLRFNVRNESSFPAMFLGRFQYLVDAQSKTYGADEALTRAMPDNARGDVFEINVNPDVLVPLAFVFELPAGVEPAEAQFKGTGRSRVGVNVRLQRRA